jgi:hypothetical protein
VKLAERTRIVTVALEFKFKEGSHMQWPKTRWFSHVLENMGQEEGREDNQQGYHLCSRCSKNLNACASHIAGYAYTGMSIILVLTALIAWCWIMLSLLVSGWCQVHSNISVGTPCHRVGMQNKTLCDMKGPCGLKKHFTRNITGSSRLSETLFDFGNMLLNINTKIHGNSKTCEIFRN